MISIAKKKITFVSAFFISFIISIPVFPQNSALLANRRTAVRYLRLAKQYASEKLWKEADSNARIGLNYDEKIADLWYLRALSQKNLGEKKSVVLPLVVTALSDSEWVDYNQDNARILYADILSQTRDFNKSQEILDAEPYIYSADAEYIRARNLYCMGDSDSVRKARERLDSARRVYPADFRFAQLFFAYEHQFARKNGGKIENDVSHLADAFTLMVPLYKNAPAELEMYAAVFASPEKVGSAESKKNRMLRAFNSKRLTSPLYAVEALKSGLLGEDDALDYFYKFSDKTIDFYLLSDFAILLKSDGAKKEFADYLNAYNGVISFDTDGDLTVNMTVFYKRGRPQQIFYDANQDDSYEWTASCDFGVPLRIALGESTLELEYSNWPYISSALYKIPHEENALAPYIALKLTLLADTLSWTPFSIEADKALKASLGCDFFVPLLSDLNAKPISGSDLIQSALSYTVPSSEREGAQIQVSLLNGTAQIASYSVGEKIYAVAQFENGIPVSRKVDMNGDGLFETVEYYAYSKDGSEVFSSAAEELQIMTNLFGSPSSGTGFYIKKIALDRNGDTVPDFTEEYLAGDKGDKVTGKISSWDTNDDGNWDVQYIKYPSSDKSKLLEEAKFHQPLSNSIVTVTSENGIPSFVKEGENVLSVTRGDDSNFYWISKADSKESEKIIIEKINQIGEQGVSTIVDIEGIGSKRRFLAVRIEKLIFALEIPDEGIPKIVEKSEKK